VPRGALTKTTNVKDNATSPDNKDGHQNRAGLC
jgi:hypothetical protein